MAADVTLHIYPIPDSLGGGRIALRELSYSKQKAIRARFLGRKRGAEDLANLADMQEALVIASLAGCDAATADRIGVDGEAGPDGLVLVTDSDAGRTRLFGGLSSKLRDLCVAAHQAVHTLGEDEIAPLLEAAVVTTI